MTDGVNMQTVTAELRKAAQHKSYWSADDGALALRAAYEIATLISSLAAAEARVASQDTALRLGRRIVAEAEQEWARKSGRYIEGTKNPYTSTLKLIDAALSQTEEK